MAVQFSPFVIIIIIIITLFLVEVYQTCLSAQGAEAVWRHTLKHIGGRPLL